MYVRVYCVSTPLPIVVSMAKRDSVCKPENTVVPTIDAVLVGERCPLNMN